ncbi:hypothetical protein [Faecalibaculum rodentium]|uniref:hypothetical protein n=1 Tax=Faecalibaculum rodentium TaxID=1702221 RepID=UPI002595EE57|nr:hypothetical protein [Faecalibaculum rodentium]
MKHNFQIVDSIPYGFGVWNIPMDDMPGYLPLCEEIPGTNHKVNQDTLKIIACSNPEPVLKAAGLGARTLKGCIQQIERLRKKAAMGIISSYGRWRLQVLEEAYPIMACLKWEKESE